MRAMLWLGSSGLLLAVMACATSSTPPPAALTAPSVPAEIQAPPDTVPVARLAAKGTQNYRCEATPTGTDWKLVAPEADLTDPSAPGTVVATHGIGPSWHHLDGSALVGDGKSAKRVASPDGTSIPWLLIPATANDKPGVFWQVVFVQRIDTQGGAAPVGGCTLGVETKVDYTATYVFYRKR